MPDIRDPIGEDGTNDRDCGDTNADVDEEIGQKRRKRDFQEETWFYRVRVGFLLTVSCACVGVVLCYLWHLVAPEHLRWLSPENISALKDLALSIIVGLSMTMLTTYFFKRK